MTELRQIEGDSPNGVALADTPRALSNIHTPGCVAAIWQRRPLESFQTWLNRLAPEKLPTARLILRAETVSDAMLHLCQLSKVPDCPERDLLVGDIAALASIFANVMDTEYVRLELDVVRTTSCAKFQMDDIKARLICTYRGTGTQYGVLSDGAGPQPVHTVPTCAAILLRGGLWPERPSGDLSFRAPTIEAGETRLVLMLDPVVEPDTAPKNHPMTRH